MGSTGMHSVNVQNTVRAKKLVWKLVMLDQLPKQNSPEGLLTLRSAWDHIDICVHHAQWYKVIGKFAFKLQLALQVFIVLAITLEHTLLAKNANTASLRRLQGWLEPECLTQVQNAMWHSDLVVAPRGLEMAATRSLESEDFDANQ